MGMLDSVTSGKQLAPPRLLIYGVEGCGKSTFCSGAPAPIFIQTEDGLGQIACNKFPLANKYDELLDASRKPRWVI